MKGAIVFPIVLSLALGWFMLDAAHGFMSFINGVLSSMDYSLVWTLTPLEGALIAVTPWITFALLKTPQNRTVLRQLGMNLLFIVLALSFFAFGFLALELKEANPLLPSFYTETYFKEQPFPYYWAIWFALSDIFVVVLFILNRRQGELER
jgi:hypothetical protein